MKQVFSLGPDQLGDGHILFEWSPKGNFLALAGSKRKVCILDRNGRLADEVQLPQPEIQVVDSKSSSCTHLKWDPTGEQLAILPSGNTVVYIWSSVGKDPARIETEFKSQEFSVLSWSKNGIFLAVGTVKGNLLMYNSRERKRIPYVGKHTKKIVSAVWNKDNMLAMAGLDRMVSITDGSSGETVKAFQLKGDPNEMYVSDRKDDGHSRRDENTYSINVSGKTIYIMQCAVEGDTPLELAFLDQYGPIQKHLWFGDGYILVGFKFGQVVVVSSHSREIGEEVHSGKYLEQLSDMSYCAALGRIAMCGSSSVRILDTSGNEYSEVKADAIDLTPNERVDKVGWSRDGQVLTLSTTAGKMCSYLAALPNIFDVHLTKVLYLTSLLEMSIVDITKRLAPVKIGLDTEPAFCGLGPTHAALGMNNQVWFYRHGRVGSGELVNKRNYMGSIENVRLNSTHAAIQVDGKVIVHPVEIEQGRQMDEFDVILPPQGQLQQITCVEVSEHFVITGSKQGILSYYLVEDCSPVNEYRHDSGGLTRIYPQPQGSRLVFEDERGNICLFNPVNDQVLMTPPVSGRVENVVWDVTDPNVFIVAETNRISVFLYLPFSLEGARIELVGSQVSSATHTPVVLSSGMLGCRLKNGSLDTVTLESHRSVAITDAMARANPQKKFTQCLALGQLRPAWECAVQLRNTESWNQLALKALDMLDLDVAIASYRMLGDASMVLSLEGIKQYEDKNLLAAHIMVLMEKDYAQAQELFLRSTVPTAALEMRKDLKHWSEALKLAETLDPDGIALICKEHAAALEMTAEYNSAKSHYQQAMDALMGIPEDKELELACRAGIARTTLHMGDIRQGRTMALQLNSVSLFKECGSILEGLQQLTEAGEMYEKAGQFERAASIYIQTKNFTAAAPLMAKVSSSKLHLQYAKAKEAEGRYSDAATAYEAAGDMDAVVRLSLEQLNAPQRAYAIVRKTRSVEAAALLARYCLQSQDFGGAVEFLLLAGQMDQAFDIAQGHNEMDTFARIVQSTAKTADYNRIAQYYEGRGEFDKAGDMYATSEQYPRAVQLYLKVGSNQSLEKAIQVIERTHSHQLGVLVLDYVNEEKDGSTKDEFRFKLNIAMGQYQDAARDAMEMARFEQEEGNYRIAHSKLFDTVKQLEDLNKAVPSDLMRMLMMLHSYTLVKSLIAIEDHTNAARMLVRVARNISKFPKHVVPILTSTVIECHRASMRKTSFEYASMLMRPEYRNSVAVKYKKKIELMVRKPDKDAEEVEEQMMECPFCNMPGPEGELQCLSCQNIIPFDIATGRRMTLADWSECPKCRFPCSSRQFIKILSQERRCPMCNDEVNLDSVRKVNDPLGAMRRKQEALTAPPEAAR